MPLPPERASDASRTTVFCMLSVLVIAAGSESGSPWIADEGELGDGVGDDDVTGDNVNAEDDDSAEGNDDGGADATLEDAGLEDSELETTTAFELAPIGVELMRKLEDCTEMDDTVALGEVTTLEESALPDEIELLAETDTELLKALEDELLADLEAGLLTAAELNELRMVLDTPRLDEVPEEVR